MARFLFVPVPVVARLWPAVAIGDALAASGHEVAWCGPESNLVPLLGPDPVIFPTGKRSYREFHQSGTAAVRELWDEYVMPLNRFIQGPVDRAVAEYQPDVVVADQYALAAALAAHQHGVRWASLCAGVLELTPPSAEPGLQEFVRTRLQQAWERAGLPPDDRVDLRFSPYLVIATTAAALAGPVPMPGHYLLVGAALGPRRTDPGFDWDWLDTARRHVLVTPGTLSAHLMHDFIARMMAVLEPMASRVQVVLNTSPEMMPDPPSHVLVAPRIPMLDLMPRLDAVVCTGGQSTVNEALVHGVPLLVAPIRLGELSVAEQVTRAGAGITVSFAAASPAQLTAAVTALLDEPGYRAQARRIGAEYAAAGGTRTAAERLVALAAGRPD
ncbi:MAG: nucleotide disphospho-sugar-binding domain-containing protein [Streptosporangiaceae bacterium]|jgi:UDP:flavonoid glycosyltransferase YjiC (YdhE family)